MRPENPLLSAQRVCWEAAGRRILGPLDFSVEQGESVAVIGPNGAGKTTLLRLLSALVPPSSGSLSWLDIGFPALSRRELAGRIAYVPQVRPSRIPLSVEQMVLLGRYPHWRRSQLVPGKRDFLVVHEALERVGLSVLKNRPVDELSGGERQAVFIGAALAQESQLLVLDEPTTHLDPSHQRDIADLIRELSADAERTVVTATHDLNFASLIADRLVALRAGHVALEGPPADVLVPEILRELFDANFEVVRGGARPVTVLHLES
jgi:iron complex transport system ATP-binding protein